MVVVDSCGWLQYIKGGALADSFTEAVRSADQVIPAIVVFEVFRVLRREAANALADELVDHMLTLTVAPLDRELAIEAVGVSAESGLATADAIIYATALAHGATLVTCDKHFAGLPGVECFPASPE